MIDRTAPAASATAPRRPRPRPLPPTAPGWAGGCPTGALDPAAVGAALELQRLRAAA